MSDKPINNDNVTKKIQQIEGVKSTEAKHKLETQPPAQTEGQAQLPTETNDQTELQKLTGDKQHEAKIQAANKLEQLEMAGPEKLPDKSFVDGANRPITVRTWESGNQAYMRAYDTGKIQVPERLSSGYETGSAGRANVSLEQLDNGQHRVKLQDIEVKPEYRQADIGGQMLNQVEQYAQKHNASEIYGVIENQDAHNYWANQADKGWAIRPNGAYGEAHHKL